jgi:AAA domain
LGATKEDSLWIHAAPTPDEAVPKLVELIRQQKPVLVVIDPLIRLARIRDEKAYAETYNALGPLLDVARECNAHIL